MSIAERAQALPCTRKIVVRIPGNMNAMWHPNDVIRPVLLPHIRFNRDMMLAKDNKPVMRLGAHKLYCNKQTSNTSMACTTYGLKSEQVRVGHIVAQWYCNQICVTHQMCHSTTVSSQIHYTMGNNVHCWYCHSRWTYHVLKWN